MHTCGHAGAWYGDTCRNGDTCRICGMEYCRDCGSPQVVRVRKKQWVQVDGRPPDQVWSEFGEVWPLCHACAAKMPPVWVEPAPPPPVTIKMDVSGSTIGFDLGHTMKIFEALSIAKAPAKGTAHTWQQPFGTGTVTVSAAKAAPTAAPKPKKPKQTPQSVLEADVEQFLRESDNA